MSKSSGARLTERQQEWLNHIRAWRRSGGTARSYAEQNGLSAQAMYQAAKDLRKRGVLPAAGRKRPSQASVAFVKVSTEPRALAMSGWRARLPNGVVLEGTDPLGAELVKLLSAV